MNTLFSAMLGNVNLLDPQNVEANRRGEITEMQSRWLNSMTGWAQAVPILLIGVFLVPFLCIFGSTFLAMGDDLFYLPQIIFGMIFLGLISYAGFGIWKIWDKSTKLRHDRENRAIRQGQGQLIFGRSGYSVQVAGRELAIPSTKNASGLLPGATYHFYYLEETGFIISAEEMYPASETQVRSALSEILASANGFSLDDLAQNRNGEVSQAQLLKVLPQAIMGVVIGLIAIVFSVPFGMGVFSSGSVPFPALVVPLLIVGIFLLMGAWMFFTAFMDMFVSSLAQVQGEGHKEKRVSGGKNRRTRYYYVINGERFQVNSRAYEALIDGQEYRLYYLPRTKKLVSIEPIDVNPDPAQYNFNA